MRANIPYKQIIVLQLVEHHDDSKRWLVIWKNASTLDKYWFWSFAGDIPLSSILPDDNSFAYDNWVNISDEKVL